MTAPRRFGPVQLATYLGLEQWQLGRAVADGLIPGPDRSRGRWSAPIADAALARIGVIRAAAGSIPDLGAVRAADVLSRRLGLEVTADGVEELARRDLLPVTGYYKDHALYDGRALEAFTETGTAADATRDRSPAHRGPGRRLPAYPAQRPEPPDPIGSPQAGQVRAWALGPAQRDQRPPVPHRGPGPADRPPRHRLGGRPRHPPRPPFPARRHRQAEAVLAALAGPPAAARRRPR